ncbi:MAG: excinuclease ABC subunit UvrC [Candidatus Spyradocola sp.]|nr:excinuclease ABC subunit UvrC [Candidatus Spyradocola sp.]
MNQTLEFKISQLPESPGVYQMKKGGEVIYVGKAVNLKNRVRQYFHSSRDHTPKVRAMVANIEDFDIILCDTELEALILECNLIKKYRPYYNILLKDDKQYPYIRIDLKQDYPRVELVRRIEKDGAKYFGPYIGATVVRDVLEVLHNSFPLRTCKHEFSFGHGVGGRHRPCIRHQMGLCLAPCTGNVMPGQYRQMLDEIIAFLNGRHEDVVEHLRRKMEEASKNWEFEKAAMYRDRVTAMEQVLQKQKAIAVAGGDQDVIAVASDGVDAIVEVIFMRGGKILGNDHFIMQRAEAQQEESLAMFLLQYYDNAPSIPREILLGEECEDLEVMEKLLSEKKGSRVHIAVPKRGEKVRLVEMARKNAEDIAQKRREQFVRQKARTVGACKELADALGLDFTPRRIEGYDISNTQGTLSVASMVVAIDGQPARSQYRHYRIKTVVGANDFASMAEVISRRFTRGERERLEAQKKGVLPDGFADLPDLVLIDGGPEQLRFAQDAIHAVPMEKYPAMFGLAKRLEEIYLPGRDDPIRLDEHSEALRLIQRIRDEAHRFAITHHRGLRTKRSVASRLEEIPGIGATRRRALLTHFSNLEALGNATLEELLDVPGMNRPAAEAVYAFFHDK